MNKFEFMEGIKIIQNNYNQKFSKEKLVLYYEELKDLDKDYYIRQIKKLIKTSPYIPNIAQIRGEKNKCVNYKQRDYSDVNLNNYYANSRIGGNAHGMACKT